MRLRLRVPAGSPGSRAFFGYRPAWEYTAALDFIRENIGWHFDPRMVDEFLKNDRGRLVFRFL
jgi:hypothetical protein